jgi:UDP-N-acetylglucosamine 2-epimerase (non-hydrolysing)
VVVHGDTFTTVLGAVLGRLLGADVAHVEAGMRSGRIMHPMPEELNRRAVARIARLHFAPGAKEVNNLRRERARGQVVDTAANTAVDALKLMTSDRTPAVPLPDEFGLLTIHRFEMLRNTQAFTETLRTLKQASRDVPVLMPAGATERARIEELGLRDLFDDRFRLVDKQPYARFVPILARASFVVTDSGGLQQECGFLGLPCAIHREATESQHGIGENLVLTGLDVTVLRDFLTDWRSRRRPAGLDAFTPSRIVVDTFQQRGYLADQS